jgi:hypothetical protein
MQLPVTTYASSTTYTISVFARARQIGEFMISVGTAATVGTGFDLLGGVAFTVPGVTRPTSDSITQLANGWYLCTITFTTGTGSTASPGAFYLIRGSPSYTGDGSNIWIWGAQITQTSFPADYVPTTTASVTQAADQIILSPGALNTTAQTIMSYFYGPIGNEGDQGGAYSINDGTSSNHIDYRPVSATSILTSSGMNTSLGTGSGTSAAMFHKVVETVQVGNMALSLDGSAPYTAAPSAMPTTLNKVLIGDLDNSNGAYEINTNVTAFGLWNGVVASTADLQRLTTISGLLSIFNCSSDFAASGPCGVNFPSGRTGSTPLRPPSGRLGSSCW